MIIQTKFKETETGIIPEDWDVKRINQVTEEIFSGGTPNTRKSEYWGGNIPWLSSGETRNTFIFETERKITELGVKNSSTRLAKAGDIVVASAGQGYTRGQVSFCMIDTYVNQSVVVLRANKEIMKPQFLFYNLVSRYNELRRISDAHSSRGSLTTKLLADLNIQIPPIREQKAIARILSDLDLKIALNRSMNSTLEAIGQALFRRWFVDFEFPDEEGKPYRSSGGEMVETELGEVPRGWRVGRIQDFGEVITGTTPTSSVPDYFGDKLPFVTPRDFISEPIVTATERYLSDKGKKYLGNRLLPKGVIMVTCIGSDMGKVAISSEESTTNQQINSIKCSKVVSHYLYFNLKTRREELRMMTGGSTMPIINKSDFSNILILIPNESTLNIFSSRILPIFNKIELNLNESKALHKIRDALLPKLMSGEIRVRTNSNLNKENK